MVKIRYREAAVKSRSMGLIGIDCATDPVRVGLAYGEHAEGKTCVRVAEFGTRSRSIASQVSRWTERWDQTLIAIDAPLGWPAALGRTLSAHKAGQPIAEHPNRLFRRETDRVIKEKIGKLPLDVGADRIARTAHAALQILEDLRVLIRADIPLAWEASFPARVAAIEVYPAGTLAAYHIPARGYKEKHAREKRLAILGAVRKSVTVGDDVAEPVGSNADVLDAVLCLVAAHDFLSADTIRPSNQGLARKEGWIWVRNRGGS